MTWKHMKLFEDDGRVNQDALDERVTDLLVRGFSDEQICHTMRVILWIGCKLGLYSTQTWYSAVDASWEHQKRLNRT